MMKHTQAVLLALALSYTLLLTSACSSNSGGGYQSGTTATTGYSRYYGSGPWGDYDSGYLDGAIDAGTDPDYGVDAPVAAPLPDMGMPDPGDVDTGGLDF